MSTSTQVIVACVLRSGGDYDGRYVERLRAGVFRNLLHPHRFVVLTDVPDQIPGDVPWRIPLREEWPGWWSKVELHRPGLFPSGALIMYFDLDTVITGSLYPFSVYGGEYAVLRDLLRPDKMIGSGMMIWKSGTERSQRVWDAFTHRPDDLMRAHRSRSDTFYLHHLKDADRVQDIWPGAVVSYKAHCRESRGGAVSTPDGARVVCFHGRPRPHQTNENDPIRELWEQS